MKNLAASIALSTFAMSGAEAVAEQRNRVAPPAVYDVAPGLGLFTDNILFGEVWERQDLAPRDRSLVTLSALVATGKSAQLTGHLNRALGNGVKSEEIGELITHLAFYSGWPNAISAVSEAKKVFDERGIGPATNSEAARIELEAAAEAARKGSVDANMGPTAPALADLTNRVLFGDLWRRPELSARDRSLITMTAVIAMGGLPDQLEFHANRAMDNGLTQKEAAEVATQMGFYAGWPRAVSAVPVLQKVFASRQTGGTGASAPAIEDLKIVRAPATGGVEAPTQYFTGRARITTQYKGDDPARIGGATVSFEAGAHTAWHSHPLGQTLFIVSGRAWVQKEGGPIEEVGPGDVVFIPPQVRHWHGAAIDSPMVHFAVSEAAGGTSVTWMEKVSEEDYRKGPEPRQQ